MNKKHKRRKNFANKLHREIFLLVVAAAIIPTGIATISLYYLIFGVTAEQIAIPEAIAYNVIPASQKVSSILLYAAPLSISIILFLAYKISHRIIGPFDRIIGELDDHIKGKEKGRIVIRKGDKFQPLVDRINKLLKK
ncbi:hypothetical protein ACFL2G_00150 [Candidatus Omnitrophota bacterium]